MADIIQKIKIIADTAAAKSNLAGVKSQTDKIPKQLKIATDKYEKSLAKLNTSFKQLGIAAAASIGIITKGFIQLGNDTRALNNITTAIQTMGTAATTSGQQLFDYFDTLQGKLGQSADVLSQIASQFIQAGATSTEQVKQLTNAAIGLGQSFGGTQNAANTLKLAMTGNVRGLKQFGIVAKEGQNAQDLLNEALRKGAIAFTNINPNDPIRMIARFKQSINDMLKGLAQQLLPVIQPIMNFIINNMNTIGNILLTGAIFKGMQIFLKMWQNAKAFLIDYIGLYGALSVQQTARLTNNMSKYLVQLQSGLVKGQQQLAMKRTALQLDGQSKIGIDIKNKLLAAQMSLQSKGLLTEKNRLLIEQTMLLLDKKSNVQLTLKQKLLASIGALLKSANAWMLIASITITTIAANWSKVKSVITGVSEQQRKLNDIYADAIKDQIVYETEVFATIDALKQLMQKQSLSNSQIIKKKSLINDLNTKYAGITTSAINYTDTLKDLNTKLANVNIGLQAHRKLLIDTAIYEANKEQLSKYIKKVIDAKNALTQYIASAALYRSIGTVEFKTNVAKFSADVKAATADLDGLIKTQQDLAKKIYTPANTNITINNENPPVKYIYTDLQKLQDQIDITISKINLLPDSVSSATQKMNLYSVLQVQYSDLEISYGNLILHLNAKDKDYTQNYLKYQKAMFDAHKNRLDAQKQYSTVNAGQELDFDKLLANINKVEAFRQKKSKRNIDMLAGGKPIQVSYLKEWQKSLLDAFKVGDQLNGILVSPVISAFNSIGSAMSNVLVQGMSFSKAMSSIWKNLAAEVIQYITSMILKMATFKLLSVILGGAFGAATSPISGGDYPLYTGTFTSIAPRLTGTVNNTQANILAASNYITGKSTVGTDLTYMGRNTNKKLDEILTAIQNFVPVQTQVIDLPTLSRANKMGTAMTLQMS